MPTTTIGYRSAHYLPGDREGAVRPAHSPPPSLVPGRHPLSRSVAPRVRTVIPWSGYLGCGLGRVDGVNRPLSRITPLEFSREFDAVARDHADRHLDRLTGER